MIGSFTRDNLRDLAATFVHDYGLDVIQTRWRDRSDNFALVARDGDALVAVHVVIAQSEDSTRDVTALGEDLIHEIRGAAHMWVADHSFGYKLIRVDVLVLIPMLDDLIGISYVEGVA